MFAIKCVLFKSFCKHKTFLANFDLFLKPLLVMLKVPLHVSKNILHFHHYFNDQICRDKSDMICTGCFSSSLV